MYNMDEVYQDYVKAINKPISTQEIKIFSLCYRIESQYDLLIHMIDVDFVSEFSYANANEMFGDIEYHFQLKVNEDFNVDKDHPLHEVNLKFRAVHDYFGHYLAGADFSWKGECAAFDLHKKMFPSHLHGILKAEVLGQAAYRLMTGHYIHPQPFVEMQ